MIKKIEMANWKTTNELRNVFFKSRIDLAFQYLYRLKRGKKKCRITSGQQSDNDRQCYQ